MGSNPRALVSFGCFIPRELLGVFESLSSPCGACCLHGADHNTLLLELPCDSERGFLRIDQLQRRVQPRTRGIESMRGSARLLGNDPRCGGSARQNHVQNYRRVSVAFMCSELRAKDELASFLECASLSAPKRARRPLDASPALIPSDTLRKRAFVSMPASLHAKVHTPARPLHAAHHELMAPGAQRPRALEGQRGFAH